MRTIHRYLFTAAALLFPAAGALAQADSAVRADTSIQAGSMVRPDTADHSAFGEQEGSGTEAASWTGSDVPGAGSGSKRPGKLRGLTVHPILSLFISGLNLGYEGSLGGRNAFEIPVYLGYSERQYSNAYLFLGTGFGYRRYLLEPGKGGYVSPQFEFMNVRRFERGSEPASNTLVFAPGLRMGYKWRWDMVVMEVGAGMTYFTTKVTDGSWSTTDDRVTGLFPVGHFAVGVPF